MTNINREALMALIFEGTRLTDPTELGKLTHEIDSAPQLNITYAPTLISLQSTMMQALIAYPEAKQAVLMALSGIGRVPLQIEG
jgi:hypothetical protein